MRDWQPLLGVPLWVWLFVVPTILASFCLLQPLRAQRLLSPIWRTLDRVYLLSGVVAAGFMVAILLIIVAQMISRWAGTEFPGSTEYAGYAMASTSFFALAYTLTRGAHIRVSILLNISSFTRFWVDAFAMWVGAMTATFFARYAIKTNFVSQLLNDRTQGQDLVPEWLLSVFAMIAIWPTQWAQIWAETGAGWVYTPVWLPQLPMSIGTALLAIALWDMLTRLLANGETSIHGEALE